MRRWLLAVPFALLLAGCIDTSAVSRFAQTAPDPSKLDTLTKAYAAVPAAEVDWDIYGRLDSSARQQLLQQVALRVQQQATIRQLNGLLVGYMHALGGLSDPKLTDISGPTKAVATGLSALKKADPGLGITDAEVTAVNDLVSLVAGALVKGWRQYELSKVIADAQEPFQALIAVERKIVQRGIIPELQNLKSEMRGTNDAAQRALARGIGRGSQGDTTHIAAFTFNRAAREDTNHYGLLEGAAKAYVQALDFLAAAHTKLYEQRNQFSKATLEQILPLLQQAEAAYKDLQNL